MSGRRRTAPQEKTRMAGKNEGAAGKDVPAIPNVPLLQRLQAELETYSTADRAIASYLLAHYPTLAFETATTLAAKVGVSEITIRRFTRKLGYRNLKTMNNELREDRADGFPWTDGAPSSAQRRVGKECVRT